MTDSIWNRTSFVLAVPYSTRWRVRPLADDPNACHGHDWRDAPPRIPLTKVYSGADREGTEAAFTLQRHWYRPQTYFSSEKIAKAATPTAYNYWLGGRAYETSEGDVTFPDKVGDLELVAAECQEFLDLGGRNWEQLAFAVFHFKLAEPTDESLVEAAQRLRRPRETRHVLTTCLELMGIAATFTQGGFASCSFARKEDRWDARWYELRSKGALKPVKDEEGVVRQHKQADGWKSLEASPERLPRLTDDSPDLPVPDGDRGYRYSPQTWRQHFELHRNSSRAFLITFAAASEKPEPCETLAHHEQWKPIHTWTYQLATGANDEQFFRLPPLSAQAGAEGAFEFEATQGRAVPDGLAIIADPLLTTTHWRDASDIQALLHSRLLDIVLLCLRQRSWLDQHAETLAKVYSTSATDEALLATLLDQGNQLGHFRNARWFTEVPGHPEATALLRALQGALEAKNVLDEATNEEDDLRRTLSMLTSARQARNAEERRIEREAAVTRRDRERERMERALAIVTVGAFAPAVFAVFAEPNRNLGVLTLVVTAVLMVVAGFFGPKTLRWLSGEGRDRHDGDG